MTDEWNLLGAKLRLPSQWLLLPFFQTSREQPHEGMSLTLLEVLIKLAPQSSKDFFSHICEHSSRKMVLTPWG